VVRGASGLRSRAWRHRDEAFPRLSFDVLDGAGRSPADYAALMDRADLLEVLLARGSSLIVFDGRTAVLPIMAFLGTSRRSPFCSAARASPSPSTLGRFARPRRRSTRPAQAVRRCSTTLGTRRAWGTSGISAGGQCWGRGSVLLYRLRA
jgi:hypothetical protein